MVVMGGTHLEIVGDEALAYRSFGEHFPVLLVLLDAELLVKWASPASMEVLGFRPEEIVGRSVFDMVHPDDIDSAANMATGVVARAEEAMASPAASALVEFPVRIRTAAGSWERCNASGRLLDSDGTMLGMIRAAKEVQALDAVIAGLGSGGDLESVLLAITDLARAQFKADRTWIIHDADGPAEVVCRRSCSDLSRAERILTSARAEGLSPEVVVNEDTWSVPILSATGETLFGVLELPARRAEGPAPLDLHLLGRVASLASIAFARHRDDQLLAVAATTDFLTGVANRRHFEARLAESALAPGGLPLTLLYVDVDDFKTVNDSYGHGVGDRVLAAIAARLSHAVRPGDFVGRLGGDEFAVAAPGLAVHDADALRQRVLAAIREPIALGDLRVELSASIGLAGAADERALETVLERGDDDMFIRKRRRSRPGAKKVDSAWPAGVQDGSGQPD